MRIRDLCGSFIRADIRLSDLEPYRRAGSDAYELLDEVPPATWARLAAWNAFLLQTYADCLVAAVALRHDVSVLHCDRDFEVLGRHTALRETRI